MPYQCFMVEVREGVFFQDGKPVTYDSFQPGAMWFDEGELCVKLPSGAEWNIDRGRILNAQHERIGKTHKLSQWTRHGEPPRVSVSPSINHVRQPHSLGYHGWLTNGELSDDIESRTYPFAIITEPRK